MLTKFLVAAVVGSAALFSGMGEADANAKKQKRYYDRDRTETRDCTPYNGPYGYYGNPWCDGGWKMAEDYPPGTSPYFDVFDLPQVRRLTGR